MKLEHKEERLTGGRVRTCAQVSNRLFALGLSTKPLKPDTIEKIERRALAKCRCELSKRGTDVH